MPWTLLPEPSATGWYVETDDLIRTWYVTSNYAISTGPEWYTRPITFDDSDPWRAWISDPDVPNTTFLRKSEAVEDFLVNPEDVMTTPENTQADQDDWVILPDPD